MVRGLYTSASGMINEQQKLDMISNNLANANTTGFKRDIYTSVPFQDMLIKRINDKSGNAVFSPSVGNLNAGVSVSEIYTDFTQSGFQKTDNSLDCAINGNGFFTVQGTGTNGTSKFYTRDGSFDLNKDGYLVTKEGNKVLGQNGTIKLNPNIPIKISYDGTITQNGNVVDKLNTVSFTDTRQLRKSGDNLYTATTQSQNTVFQGQVIQGSLEDSNVNTIKEMVAMINCMRNFESNQKALKSTDDLLSKAVNEVGSAK